MNRQSNTVGNGGTWQLSDSLGDRTFTGVAFLFSLLPGKIHSFVSSLIQQKHMGMCHIPSPMVGL